MIDQIGFNMAPHWYFARNIIGNRLVLIADDRVKIKVDWLKQMHEALKNISPTYANSIQTGEVIEPMLIQHPEYEFLKTKHAQTKPKLIDPQQVW